MMVVVTLLLASTFAVGVTTFSDGLDATNYNETVSSTDGSPWSGTQGDLVRLSTTQAGATNVSVRLNFTIESEDTIDDSLESVYLEVKEEEETPDVFSDTELADLDRVEIDEDSDGSIDQEITDDVDAWEVENDGSALEIGFGGSAYTASAGDSIIVVFGDAKNPESTGTYELRAETNGDDDNRHSGTVNITA